MNVAIVANTDGVDDDGVFKSRQIHVINIVFFEEDTIGFEEDFFFAAIKLIIDGHGGHFHTIIDHALQAVGKLKFVVGLNVIFDIKIQCTK